MSAHISTVTVGQSITLTTGVRFPWKMTVTSNEGGTVTAERNGKSYTLTDDGFGGGGVNVRSARNRIVARYCMWN